MKKLKKITALALSAITALGVTSFAACNKDENKRKVDENKTQLYIGNFDGGYGHEWLEKAAALFEQRYEQTSFETGKTGVQIWITNQKDEYTGYTFYQRIAGMSQDIFITAQPRQEIIDGSLIVSLNDIMDEPLTEFGENKTIRQKLAPYYKEAYNMGETTATATEKVTFLPMAEAFFGNCVYDIELFEDKKYFIGADGKWSDGTTKSAGMDGVTGTFDDGLPTTETEFFELLDRIYTRGDIPLTFAGQYTAYMNAWCFNIFCNFDDGEGQRIYNTLEGEYVLYGDTEKTTFNGHNFYDAQRLPGRLYALESAYKLVKEPNYYSSEAFKTSQSHIEAQDEFITSAIANQRVAMLIEGTWWENEASDTFNRMANSNEKYSKMNRRFGLMPTFRHSKGTAEKTTFLAANQTMFINANTDYEELSKLFLKFVCTDEVLEMFTKTTGCPSPYEYTISQDTYNSLSNFGKNVWDIHENKNDKFVIVTENRNSAAYMHDQTNYPQNFESNVNARGETKGGTTIPFTFFKYDTTNATAKDYFDCIYDVACRKYDSSYASEFGARN